MSRLFPARMVPAPDTPYQPCERFVTGRELPRRGTSWQDGAPGLGELEAHVLAAALEYEQAHETALAAVALGVVGVAEFVEAVHAAAARLRAVARGYSQAVVSR